MLHYRLLGLCAFAAIVGCKDREPTPKPVETYVRAHSVKQLMARIVQPQADIYWKSAGSVSDATGSHDLTPTTDEGWLAARNAAATVTEMGNLLMTPPYAEGRGADWIQFSRSLVEIGRKAEKAAADHNADGVMDTGGTIYAVCSACHQMYPPLGAPPAAPAAPSKANP